MMWRRNMDTDNGWALDGIELHLTVLYVVPLPSSLLVLPKKSFKRWDAPPSVLFLKQRLRTHIDLMKAHQRVCDSGSSQWPDPEATRLHEISWRQSSQKLPKQMPLYWISCNMLQLKNYLQLRIHQSLHKHLDSATLRWIRQPSQMPTWCHPEAMLTTWSFKMVGYWTLNSLSLGKREDVLPSCRDL